MDKGKEIEKQYDRIYRYCYFKLRKREAAEDITQETFLRFLENETYQNEGKALQYFYTVAGNLCIDEYRKAGRAIDQSLLEEMQEGYGKIPADADRYTLTEEYQTYARPYSAISNFVRSFTGMNLSDIRQWEPDEQQMYQLWRLVLEKEWDSYSLTQKEKDFWGSQEENLERPIIFRYKEGWWELFDCMNTIGLLALMAVAICLSGVFTEEHSRKTDQLILCSRYGRKTVYWAKQF